MLGPTWFDHEKQPRPPLYRHPEALALGAYTVPRPLVEGLIMIRTSRTRTLLTASKSADESHSFLNGRGICTILTIPDILHPLGCIVNFLWSYRSLDRVLEGNCGTCTSAWSAYLPYPPTRSATLTYVPTPRARGTGSVWNLHCDCLDREAD
jgi:hypothetical protein